MTLALLQNLRHEPAPASSERHHRRRLVRRPRAARRRGAAREPRVRAAAYTDERETTDGGW